MFRRLASKSIKPVGSEASIDIFLSLQDVHQHAIRAKLLEALQGEAKLDVRHKICDAVAEVARQYADDGKHIRQRRLIEPAVSLREVIVGKNWQELLQVLFALGQSQGSAQREGAFRIFSTTPGIIQNQHEEAVLGALARGFKDDDVSVSVASTFNLDPHAYALLG